MNTPKSILLETMQFNRPGSFRMALAAIICFGLAMTSALAGSFTPGNLAVFRVGEGGTITLSSTSTNGFIDEYTPGGSFVQSIAIPTSGSTAIVFSGSAASDGAVSRSPNGRWLCFAGYNTTLGYANVATSAGTAVPRAIGVVDGNGVVTFVTNSTLFHGGNNIRSAASDGTNNFWSCGTANSSTVLSGVNYFGLTSPTNYVYAQNLRWVQIINGDLYFSTGASTPGLGVHKFSGLPVSAASVVSPSPLIGTTGTSPYGFAINSGGNIAYLADDAGSTGIRRYTNDGTGWTFVYTLNTTRTRGLVVDWNNGGNPIVYATTTETSANKVIQITDTGASSSATTIATAAANTAFRGVAFAPLAAPAITACAASQTISVGLGYQAAIPNLTGQVVATPVGAVVVSQSPAAGTLVGLGATTVTLTASNSVGVATCTATVTVQDVVIAVTNRIYSAYRTDLTAGTYTYLDCDPAAGSPVRASQRSLGYREVDYKGQVPPTLYFSQPAPTTNAYVVAYDYSAQSAKTNQVGFWVDKDLPIIIGPDGNAYITDGHHTTAGYMAAHMNGRQFVPGLNFVVMGHIVANYYNPANPQAPDDAWWTARAAENNAYLYGTNGNALTLPAEPNYANLQPILHSTLAMPISPSTNGSAPMFNSVGRSLAWGLADAIVMSALDSSNKKIAGYKKSAPGSSVDINFVEFFWADYLRNRLGWDNTLSGSPYGSPNGDASVTAAPLSFFAAVANGIALARSEAYLDQYGRKLSDYTNSVLFGTTTVNWANGSLSNGLAKATDTYHLYFRDDSGVIGAVQPSALSTNILHVDTASSLTITQTVQNISTLIVNGGHRVSTSWKDSTVSNSTLVFPAGSGVVALPVGNTVAARSTLVSNGTLQVSGTLNSPVSVAGGTVKGTGTLNGSLAVLSSGTLAPGASIGTLTVTGAVSLAGNTVMEANKTSGVITSDLLTGISTLTYGGTLTISFTGEALVAGDMIKLLDAAVYQAAFTSFTLPALDAGLVWDSSRLVVDGKMQVLASGSPALSFASQPSSRTNDVGSTVTLVGGAVGTLPITYQWRCNGTDLAGQTNSSLVFSSIQESNQGTYVFVAANVSGSITSAPAVVTVNQAPIAQSQSVTLYWNNTLNITLGASDADGDAFTYTVNQPAHGTVTGTAPNVVYTPTANYTGADSFTFKVNDGRLNSATVTVSITVLPGFTYTDTDLLLVFRKDGFSDVLFNLGSVSNYLGLAPGTLVSVANWNYGLVAANFGSLSGVKYALLAATPSVAPQRAWFSDGNGANTPTDETFSKWGGQYSKVNAIGAAAATYYNSSNQSLILPSSDVGSYTYIASSGGALDVTTLSGTVPFPVEIDFGGWMRLFELNVSGAIPKPAATQVGAFALTMDGQLSFTAGVQKQVVGLVGMEAYAGPAHNGVGSRTVTFKATDGGGSVLATWNQTLTFGPDGSGNGVASYTLNNVPSGTINVSAKTAWNLRKKLTAAFTGGQGIANFTGASVLPAGDINDSNLVDIFDYFKLAAAWYHADSSADIDGSGLVNLDDYFLLANRWYQAGDPQ